MRRMDPKKRDILEATVVGQAIQIFRDEVRARQRGEAPANRPFVAISREFGCEGTDLAVSLAEALNKGPASGSGPEWQYYDRALLDRLAEDHDLKVEAVRSAEEHHRTEIEQYLSKELSKRPDDYDVYQYLVSAITTLAKRGNVIFVGRGAHIITQTFGTGFYVRLYGSPQFKVKRIRDCMPDISDDVDAVASFIGKESKKRDSFIERFTLKSPSDPLYYHLMINNGKFSVPEMTQLVLGGMKCRGIPV